MAKSVSKKTRFEVFKRDSFKCQYCGKSAPEVVLHVDHIKPLSKGGLSDILNLVTSCADCNHGKSDRELSDKSAVEKQRGQLEQLQERREQLDMLMQWGSGLSDIEQETAKSVADHWTKLAPGWSPNENGIRSIKRWVKQFGVAEILQAMQEASDSYLKFDSPGRVNEDSWDKAFNKIPAIARTNIACRDNPDLKELFYLRGILRNKVYVPYEDVAMDDLKSARSWGIPMDRLRGIVRGARSWTSFRSQVLTAIKEAQQQQGQGVG